MYFLFALTGIGLVLPGALLPLLAGQWGWGDGRSGSMFLAFFVGSTLGALLARGLPSRLLLAGTLGFALPIALLNALRGPAILVGMLVCGLGLGLTMTTISLVQSRRSGPRRLADLTRLNLVWAIGACSGPALLLKLSAWFGLASALRADAALSLAAGLCTAWTLRNEGVPAAGSWKAWRHIHRVPAYFALTLPLSTGVEAGMGGWLTTYASRQHAAGSMTATVTALWAGLLLSRLAWSGKPVATSQQRWLMPLSAALTVLGVLTEIASSGSVIATTGAFLAGFGIGPLYPYLLSRLLDRGEAGNAGFLLAGTGSALLPLLIGLASQHAHSLRAGLLIPLLGSVVLLASLLRGAPQASEPQPL